MRHASPPQELPAAGREIQAALAPANGNAAGARGGGGSFTALLGLPTSQAMELLLPRTTPPALALAPAAAPAPTPTFPSDPHLVDRAARLSTFAPPSPSSTSPAPPLPAAANAGKRKADLVDRASKVGCYIARLHFQTSLGLAAGPWF